MTKSVLLLGRTEAVVDDARQRLRIPDIRILGGHGDR